MATPTAISFVRKSSLARIAAASAAIAAATGIDPPAPVSPHAKAPDLREAKTVEGIGDFLCRLATSLDPAFAPPEKFDGTPRQQPAPAAPAPEPVADDEPAPAGTPEFPAPGTAEPQDDPADDEHPGADAERDPDEPHDDKAGGDHPRHRRRTRKSH